MASANEDIVLIGDVGGTHVRLALCRAGGLGPSLSESIARYEVAHFESLTAAVRHYLGRMHLRPTRAVLAVAGPVAGGEVRVTNNPWSISAESIRREFDLHSVRLVNDFAAMSAGVVELPGEALQVVGPVQPRRLDDADAHVVAVIGPGTGLGVGLLLRAGDRWRVIETEGGHAGFAPTNEEEAEIWRILAGRFGRVSNERLICGPGLVNLYQAVCTMRGEIPVARVPEAVTAAAESGEVAAKKAVEVFATILGGIAGDVALTSGARDGVYLAGGLVPPLLPWILRGGFRQRFEDKGRMSQWVAAVPTVAVTCTDTGLLGAGALAEGGRVVTVRE